MSVDKTLLELVKKSVKEAMQKKANADAFVPMPGGQPPADPAMGGDPMAGGMPPEMMDPAMMGGDPMAGGMPPMDPAMMDPMMGGMPPEGGAPPAGDLPMDPVQLVSTVIAPIVRDAVREALSEASVDIKKKKTEGDAPPAPPADPMAAMGGMPPVDPMMMGGMPPMDSAAAAIGGMPAEGMMGLDGMPVDPGMKMGSENTKVASARDGFLQKLKRLKELSKD